MHDIISNKTCSIAQIKQKTLRFVIFLMIRLVTWNGFSKATTRKRFLITFSQKYVLMYKNEMKVIRNHNKNKRQC